MYKTNCFTNNNYGDTMFENLLNINWSEVNDVVLRSILSLLTLFLVTKMLGKKQVSQLSLFDYVIGISIGNFAAEMTINLDSQEINGIIAVLIFGGVAYMVDILTMKSIFLRRYFMGVPTIVIQNGKLMKKNLKKIKFDINDLLEECRGSGYFDISEIEYALMEANGKISILPKGEYKPLTIKDMNLKVEKQGLCANVVIDGKLMKKNLLNMNKDKDWLIQQLKVQGYSNIKEVFLATLDLNDKVIVYEKNDNEKINDVLE